MNNCRICAECIHWTMGDIWESPIGRDHGVTIECKGWCLAKPNRRKRWNYHPATKCKLFDKRPMRGFIYEGGDNNSIEGDLYNISELIKELVEDNKI